MQILFNVFFFQAEDGIRDVAVTGVQTCALPISRLFAPTRTERTTRPSSRCARAAAGYGGRGVFRYAGGTSGCGEARISIGARRMTAAGGAARGARSEEGRGGKEGRSRGAPYH